MSRLLRKLKEAPLWLLSVRNLADFPAALLLWVCRTLPLNGSGLSSRCFRRLVPRLRLRPKTLLGFSLGIDPSDIAEITIYEEVFIETVYDLALVPFEPDLVLDCGGFRGYFTLLARARFPSATFVVFEPHPSNYAVMCSNFERNGVDIDARSQAVSNHAGEMLFSGSGCGGRLGDYADEAQPFRVEVANLCEVTPRLSPRRLLLKLDVEGEEVNILPDLVRVLPATCALFFESHHGIEAFTKLDKLLRTAGFAVTRRCTRDDAFIDAFALRS